MKPNVLQITQICYAQAIAACGRQFVKSRIIREIRAIRLNSLFLGRIKGRKLQPLITCHLLFLAVFTSCVDFNDTTSPVTATIQLERPADFVNMTDMAGYTVTLQSAEGTVTALTDALGCAVIGDLAPGTYDVSVSADISAQQYQQFTGRAAGGSIDFVMTASASQQTLAQDATLRLPLAVYPRETLVIGKVYASTSKIDGGSYSVGKYIELFNNSDSPVDAAGLYIGLLESESTIAYQVYPPSEATMPDTLCVKQVFRIPADTPVMVAPGGTLLIANSAIDHSSQNDFERNLRDADLEAKDASKRTPNNADTPALELVYSTYSSISNMNLVQGGPTSLVIFRTDQDVSSWRTVYAYGKTRGNLFLQVPAATVLDGVEIVKNKAQTGPDIRTKRLQQSIDAGYTYVNSAAGTVGERLVRRTAAVTATGRKILQDTNNSLNDFVCTDTISPRNYLEP